MKNKHLVAGIVAALVLVSCKGMVGEDGVGGDGGLFGIGGGREKAGEERGEQRLEKKAPIKVEYPTGRNAPCEKNSDCEEGFTCIESTGTCQEPCKENADCGNGYHCRSGECKGDCSGMNEKCSERRPCCFFDTDEDGQTDVGCTPDENGDDRCLEE